MIQTDRGQDTQQTVRLRRPGFDCDQASNRDCDAPQRIGPQHRFVYPLPATHASTLSLSHLTSRTPPRPSNMPRIQTENDVQSWRRSEGYNRFLTWIQRRCERIKGRECVLDEGVYIGCTEVTIDTCTTQSGCNGKADWKFRVVVEPLRARNGTADQIALETPGRYAILGERSSSIT